MKYRTLGRTGWQVSEIGYGMWGMAGWTGSDDDQTRQALQLAVDLGCNFFDTAWAYGDGRSEAMLGELVRANPDRRLFTATKIPPRIASGPAAASSRWTIAFRRITSASTSRAACRTRAAHHSTWSSFTRGKTHG
jgi:aryl-alcohol dehydrogenase-like predicted oxidoreductase